jgi:Domain of unknown function (DUF4258)
MDVLRMIRIKIAAGRYEYSKHALDQSIIRDISVDEVEEAFTNNCELIEDYPDDKFGPSCLILGFTLEKRALHIQCSYPDRLLVKIITVYEPDRTAWINLRIRTRH